MPFDDDNADFTALYPSDMPDGSPISSPTDYLAQLAGLVDTHYALNPILPPQQTPWNAEPASGMADTPEYAPRSLLGTVQKLGLDKDDDADPLQAYRYTPYATSGAFDDFLGGKNAYGQSNPNDNRVDDWVRQPNQAMLAEPAFAYDLYSQPENASRASRLNDTRRPGPDLVRRHHYG